MKILVQLGHPAQFHFFKNSISNWIDSGHKVRVLIRSKDVLEELLQNSGFEYVNIEKKRLSPSLQKNILVFGLIRFYQLFFQQLRFLPNIVISPDPVLAKICKFFPASFIAVGEDDYFIIEKLANYLFPSVNHIVAPKVCDYSPWQYKKIEFDGYMKLAYLHPNRFTPNLNRIKNFLHKKNYVIIRLVSLSAHHDVGIKGIDNEILDRIISIFEKRDFQIFISSEKVVDEKYLKYQQNVPVVFMHDLLAYSSFLVCDSQSLAVEASMLGTPSVRFNDFAGKISVLNELETKYQLTYGIHSSEPEKLFAKLDELLALPDLKEVFQQRRQKMLADKIDVTAFFTWFIENYPESAKIMRSNPDYQYRFK